MKVAFIIVALLAFNLQHLPGCGAGKGEMVPNETSAPAQPAQGDLQKIYVQEAETITAAAAGEETVINVSGNLPSPAYKLERVDVKIEGNVVELTPLASHDRGKMAAQVLVPFNETVKVKLPKAGEYTVRVVGRGENRESKITVK
jgi:hypothetical protein